jgi:hypothetical protein
MAQYLPRFFDGDKVPVTAAATITGGQLVTTAGLVAGAAAVDVAGVAGYDVVSGQVVTVFREGIHIGTASGSIANGDPLCAGAAGTLRTWVAGTDAVASRIGRAWSAAANAASVTYALINV